MKLGPAVRRVAIGFALAFAISGQADARVFTQKPLNKKYEGHVESVAGDRIRLKLESGASVPLRLSSLSEADQKYAAAWLKGRRELRLKVTAGSGVLKQISHGDPKVMLEPTDYHITVENLGKQNLSDVIFIYSIYYEVTEQSTSGQHKTTFRKLGKRGIIKTDSILQGEAVGFVTEPIHISFTPHSGKRDEKFRPPFDKTRSNSWIKSWRETLKGVVIETIAGGELVHTFEFEEGSGKPGAAVRLKGRSTLRDERVWKGKNGAKFTGVFIKEEGNVLHILHDEKVSKVSRKNLSPETLAWYEWARSGEAVVRPVAEIADNAYEPIGEIPEDAIPAEKE